MMMIVKVNFSSLFSKYFQSCKLQLFIYLYIFVHVSADLQIGIQLWYWLGSWEKGCKWTINHISIQNIWDTFWLQITQRHCSVICKIELEGDGESLYWFGTPVPHRYWCVLATRNKTCQLWLQGNKHVVEQELKPNERMTLNMDRH